MSAYWTVIIKNYSDSTSDIIVEDLGLPIAPGSQITLSDQFTYDEITGSNDLRELVETSELVVNDGSDDLDVYEGIRWITLQNIKDLEDGYYSKEELQSGEGIVHWNNIIGAPSSALVNGWIDPVEYRVKDISDTPPEYPDNLDIFANTSDKYYYIWDSTSWVYLETFSIEDRVINLSDPIENIYEYNGSSWIAIDSTAEDNWAVTVGNDGDGKQAIYSYESTSSKWIKIADVDLSDHIDGGESKHDASEIDVEGTYSNILATPSDLESTIGSIDTVLGTVLKSDRLDIKSGFLCVYDDDRSKWLSVARPTIAFGKQNLVTRRFLGFYGSTFPSNKSGIRMPRNATIVSISGQFSNIGSGVFQIIKNDAITPIIASLTISSALGGSDITINADVNAGDYIQCGIDALPTGVYDPFVFIELAWRP